jgi:predicted N-acetyltransferase YhbS
MKSANFLQEATPQRIAEAAALNHCRYIGQSEETNGEDAFRSGNYDWTPRTYNGNEAVIAYPRYDPSTLTEDLKRFMDQCRRQGIKVVSVQTLGDEDFPVLAPVLLAQGFGSGGKHYWLALDLARMNESFAAPEDLRIEIVEDEAEWLKVAPDDLPNRRIRCKDASSDEDARRSWHFSAWLGNRPVGHVQLLTTRGPLGVAGLYQFGVVPDETNRGIGKAVLRAACRFARDLGCRYAVMMSGRADAYRDLGFEPVGEGQSWWIQEPEIDVTPTPESIAFVEAVGRGDVETLDRLTPPDDLDEPLLCCSTPLEVAAFTHQPASAEWLISHGATPDLVSLWALGWKERIVELLSRRPELVNRRFGQDKKVPLHEAVWRNDPEFARFLLEHGADPSLEDESFSSTPLGWAEYLGRPDLLPILEKYAPPETASLA